MASASPVETLGAGNGPAVERSAHPRGHRVPAQSQELIV